MHPEAGIQTALKYWHTLDIHHDLHHNKHPSYTTSDGLSAAKASLFRIPYLWVKGKHYFHRVPRRIKQLSIFGITEAPGSFCLVNLGNFCFHLLV